MTRCDYCEQVWEHNFFCKKCSGLTWIEDDESWQFLSVCENCCDCYLRKAPKAKSLLQVDGIRPPF